MATFISVPLKKSSEVDLSKPLSKFISATYPSGEEQAEYCRAAEELNKLRKSAVGRPLDKHESSLETLFRYYDQLCCIEAKFPFSENQICLTFTWKDAFDKGSLFGGSTKLVQHFAKPLDSGAIEVELASLLLDHMSYSIASGAFAHIKDTVLSALNREPTMDLSPDTVGTLSQIMLAQAQEVFFLKAAADKMKDAIIAKLANQAADYYGDAFKQCQYRENLPKEVLPVLAAKHCIMQANAEYHQSILAKQQKKFGEEISRLQHAAELVKTVASRYDEYVNVKELSDKISRALTAAKKDNDFIYHDRIPDLKDLEPIGKASMVKPTPVSVPISQKFTDLFEKMVPLTVQQALSGYNQRKALLINSLIGQMKEATNVSNGFSVKYPSTFGNSLLFSGVVDKLDLMQLAHCSWIIGNGRSKELLFRIDNDTIYLCLQSFKMLAEEEATDNELKTKFKERWQRTPSSELYKSLRSEGDKCRAMLDQAVHADKTVKDRYAAARNTIALLCKPEAELSAAIPSANPAKTLQGSEVVTVLKTLLAQLDEVKKEREALEKELKSISFDMTSKFLTALAQDGVINEEAISVSELDRIYGSHTQNVQTNLKKQEELLNNIRVSYEDFSKMKQSNTETNQREEVLKNLAVAHDSFVELLANLKEGTKFYNDLVEIILRYQNRCSDIVFARKTEREELLKDLQQSIAREPSAPSLAVPAYQTAGVGSVSAASDASHAAPTPAPRTAFVHKQHTDINAC
ncbi:programmed cell death 6-interacting protein [Protopterus annectens]|uniref:programmed cell death 6-interacting protein n=1 Tax=Protopterus annectens TaxID=7888 RepID=UPI001CF95E54|nr:programmed cell death 6-interacting protein [Protopterus annectens]